MWGEKPNGSNYGEKRTVPYVTDNNGSIRYFAPIEGENYMMTIVINPTWEQPLEVWTHDIKDDNGKFSGNLPCKKMDRNGHCPLCDKNDQAQKYGIIQNRDRPYPLKKKFYFPVIIDGVDGVLYWKGYEKLVQNLVEQIKITKAQQKFVVKKIGSGTDTNYIISGSGVPIELEKIAAAQTVECSKKPFIDDTNYDRFGGSNNSQPVQQTTQQTYTNAFVNNTTAQVMAGAEHQPVDVEKIEKAKSFIYPFGEFAGKPLGSLNFETLKLLAKNTTGDIQEYATLVLNSLLPPF